MQAVAVLLVVLPNRMTRSVFLAVGVLVFDVARFPHSATFLPIYTRTIPFSLTNNLGTISSVTKHIHHLESRSRVRFLGQHKQYNSTG